jgi:hypothetical protein
MSIIDDLRQYRIKNIALFDVITALVGLAWLLSLFVPNQPKYFYFGWSLLLVFPVAILTHYVFGVQTTLNTMLGLK